MFCPNCGEECTVGEDKSGKLKMYCFDCDEYYEW